MGKFKSFLAKNILNEAMITFGKKAYPKFNNIVIMAGGAGSGKGFIQSNLIGIEGKVFDVDALKKSVQTITNYDISKFKEMVRKNSSLVNSKIKKQLGNISHLDLRNPENVEKLHFLVKSVKIEKIQKKTIADSIALADPNRKPNLIFDVTLKEPKKLIEITELAHNLGYPKENIHIVWVLNDVDIAMKQNKGRARVVPENILVDTHEGALNTMAEIINSEKSIQKYLDGVIAIVFNRFKKDATVFNSQIDKKTAVEIAKRLKIKNVNVDDFKLPLTINKALYVIAKEKGKAPKSLNDLIKETIRKLLSFMKKADIEREEYWLDIASDTKKWIKALASGKLSADDEKQKLLKYIQKNKIK